MNRTSVCMTFAAILLVLSCNGKKGSKVVSNDSAQTEDTAQTIGLQSQSGISEVSEKMQKNEKLTEFDYDRVCDFLLDNNDESASEETGYRLFNYLKGSSSNNAVFLSYLDKKDKKEKILRALIQIMCIDIGEENYSYDTFIKDFPMFRNSMPAKNAFDECMSNLQGSDAKPD